MTGQQDWEFNLINDGILYPYVQSQQNKGICYACSGAEAIWAVYARENPKAVVVELSTQQLADHLPRVFDYPKRGYVQDECGFFPGCHFEVFLYAKAFGLCADANYPKRASRWDEDEIIDPIPSQNERYVVEDYCWVNDLYTENLLPRDIDEQINTRLHYQPMVGNLRAFHSFMEINGQEVYMGNTGNESTIGLHSTLIVGYGVRHGVEYFKIKNSYGEEWGDQGYAKIRRDLMFDLIYPTRVNRVN